MGNADEPERIFIGEGEKPLGPVIGGEIIMDLIERRRLLLEERVDALVADLRHAAGDRNRAEILKWICSLEEELEFLKWEG